MNPEFLANEVNGPGETRNAEVGIHLGGKELAVLKVRGERVRTFRGKDEVNPEFLANALLEAAQQLEAVQTDKSV